ncbi:hypothetical protein PI125_g7257 [Phytophthora idaei]|nr:hypothetical protein PI125_g7257 [Phytophthora idaei]
MYALAAALIVALPMESQSDVSVGPTIGSSTSSSSITTGISLSAS